MHPFPALPPSRYHKASTPPAKDVHPLFRAFCPNAVSATDEIKPRRCVCPVMLLLLPLALLVIAAATGSLFDIGSASEDISQWLNHHDELMLAETAQITRTFMLIAAGLLLAVTVVYVRKAWRHRAANH